jgi:hypothetical protein
MNHSVIIQTQTNPIMPAPAHTVSNNALRTTNVTTLTYAEDTCNADAMAAAASEFVMFTALPDDKRREDAVDCKALFTTAPHSLRPPQTPQLSIPEAAVQQAPEAGKAELQQTPLMSTATPAPPHTPHASTLPTAQQRPDASASMPSPQHKPDTASITLGQQVPTMSTKPATLSLIRRQASPKEAWAAGMVQPSPRHPGSHSHTDEEHT